VLAALTLVALLAAPVEPPLEATLAQAAADGKPVFLDVYATWCAPCHRLESEVLSTPDVKRALQGYRVQRYDAERGNGLKVAQRYGIDEYPTLLILNPDGVQIAHIRAYTVEALVRALDEWRPVGATRGTFAVGETGARGEDPAYLLVSGLLMDRSGRASAARALYDLAEAMDPNDARGLASRAAFRRLRQDISGALVRNRGASLLAFVSQYPGGELSARALAAIAQLAPAMRPPPPKVREASQAVLKGLTARKDHLSLDALAWTLVALGFQDLALEAARASRAISPKDVDHLVVEAAALQAGGRQGEAAALLQQELKANPAHPWLGRVLAWVQRGQRLDLPPPIDLFSD